MPVSRMFIRRQLKILIKKGQLSAADHLKAVLYLDEHWLRLHAHHLKDLEPSPSPVPVPEPQEGTDLSAFVSGLSDGK